MKMPITFSDKVSQNNVTGNNSINDSKTSIVWQFCSYSRGRYKLVIPWALLLALAMWKVVPNDRILIWLIVVMVSQVVSRTVCAASAKALAAGRVSNYWMRALTAGIALDALVMGSAGIYLFPANSMPHQFILALLLCFMGGIASVTNSAHLPSSCSSVLLVMLPLSGAFCYEGSEFSLMMGAVLLLVTVALIIAGVRMNKILFGSLMLQFQKDELIGSLSDEKEKIEELNHELEAEVLERQLLVESLRRSEDRYRAVVEGQTELVCRLLGDYTFSFVNEACGRFFGVPSEDLLGRSFLEFVHPSDAQSVRGFFALIDSGAPSRTLEHRMNNHTSEVRWLQWTCYVTPDKSGQVKEIQGVGRDITGQRKAEEALQKSHEELERRVHDRTAELEEMNRILQLQIGDRIKAETSLRDSEQRFRTIFENATDCIFVKDRDLKYSHLNPAMQSIFEINASDAIGLTDTELYGAEQASRFQSEDLRVLGGQVIEAEHILILKNRELAFNCVKVPMMDSSGNITGLCGIARDVTERLSTQVKRPRSDLDFKSSPMRQTLDQARLAATSDSLVLLLGESGSGKDYLARHLHDFSRRSGGPFFSINCAALPPDIAESELFGHEAGSFTGAHSRKRGMLELAEGGTLLLNEIGELSLMLQAKLLTFLDTQSFTRVGGEANIQVNARLIAATNRDLRKEVEANRFRHDLYHRLNVFCIQVPPLRERLEDLPLLVDAILSELCAKLGRGEAPRVDARCFPILADYHWPGNVRELRNVLERALILSKGGKIKPEVIRLLENQKISPEEDDWCYKVRFPVGPERLSDISREVKTQLIKEALRRSSGVRKDAANLLGVSIDSFKYQSKSVEK